jgi:predicted DNA-binding protein with PD1-like motif
MHYTKGNIGRVFVLKFDHGDVFLDKLRAFAKKERLSAATITFLGALREGQLVTGPKKPVIPPSPNKVNFKEGWEIMGIGTIFANKSGPQIHIHASMGKKNKVLTGCVRGNAKVFLVVEAVVLELKKVRVAKEIDPKTGINLLKII